MRKIIVTEFITLDGVIEAPGPDGSGFKYAGWSGQYWNDEIAKFKLDEVMAADALLLGRITYDGFAKAWPGRSDEQGFADKMNSMEKYVVSKSLQKAEWNNTTIISDNLALEIAKLKEKEGKDILVAGSSQLVETLLQLSLIDEFSLLVYPVVLGEGKRLFKEETHAKLKLLETKKLGEVVLLRYESVR